MIILVYLFLQPQQPSNYDSVDSFLWSLRQNPLHNRFIARSPSPQWQSLQQDSTPRWPSQDDAGLGWLPRRSAAQSCPSLDLEDDIWIKKYKLSRPVLPAAYCPIDFIDLNFSNTKKLQKTIFLSSRLWGCPVKTVRHSTYHLPPRGSRKVSQEHTVGFWRHLCGVTAWRNHGLAGRPCRRKRWRS